MSYPIDRRREDRRIQTKAIVHADRRHQERRQTAFQAFLWDCQAGSQRVRG